jgi:hypothetical protein
METHPTYIPRRAGELIELIKAVRLGNPRARSDATALEKCGPVRQVADSHRLAGSKPCRETTGSCGPYRLSAN